MAHVERSVFINAPVEKVFDYIAEPNNLVKWVHNCLEVSEVVPEGTLREGTTYREAMKLPAGIKIKCVTKICKYERPFKLDFESPFAGTYLIFAHKLEPKDNGALVTEIGDYTMRGGILGKAIDKLYLERIIIGNIEQTVKNLKAVIESR